ncbi:MAG: sugar ABC transporter ATP-binding protein [Planctomycetes bacterium]|nr:sugar ABC transporter ATP-binding protein [Planctomycetota bacterium]
MATLPAETPRLRVRGLCKRFGPTLALAGVDLEVAAGEVHVLLGENGAGKSTLLGILAGVLRPDAGRMEHDGAPWAPTDPAAARHAGLAMIHQELALAPHLTVAENVLLGAEPVRGPFLRRTAMRAAVRDALRRVGRPELPVDAPVGRLPIADRQLVEIARAVALGARIIVLDEPTSSLGRDDVEALFRLIGELRDDGCSVIYVSHFLEEARRIGDRYTVLRDGSSVASGALGDVTQDELVAAMVGREVGDLYPRSKRSAGEAVLRVDGLVGEPLPHDASLELHRGEVLGIAGLVGAGRTELLRALFGLAPVRSGAIRIGVHHGPASPALRWQQGAGMVSEDRKGEGLALGMSVAENLALARLPRWLTRSGLARDTEPFARRLAVRCASLHQPVRALSGGNQQKIAVARLLHADVDVLLLDEPTRGVDVGARAAIYAAIDDLATGRDGRPPRAVLVVSSYLPELLGTCDRIAVMARGRLGPARPVATLDEHAILLEASSSPSR